MRKHEKEITDPAEIEEILQTGTVMRLGLSDDGQPYVVPLSYGYADGHLYFHCAPKGRKLDIIAKNNRVCFQIDTGVEPVRGEKPCDWSMKFRSVIGFGTAALLEAEEEKLAALSVIMKQHDGPTEGYKEGVLRMTTVVRIDVDSMTGKRSPKQA